MASAGGEPEANEEATEDLSQEEAMLAFSDCMRENGVEEFPDVGDGGAMMGEEIVDDPDFDSAMEACQHFIEDFRATSGGPGDTSPIDEETAREFAECMRENGVEEFPDPTDDGMALNRELLDDPDFEAASETCSEIHEVGLGGGN
ncbi:hypothetical protein GCM10029992_01670 [Glycomyces albus]